MNVIWSKDQMLTEQESGSKSSVRTPFSKGKSSKAAEKSSQKSKKKKKSKMKSEKKSRKSMKDDQSLQNSNKQ